MSRLLSCLFVLAIITASEACRKKDVRTEEQKVKDTAISYAREIYIWYKQIPSSFDAQRFADPNAIMRAIRDYSVEPGFAAPVDRWSFAMLQQEWRALSRGVEADFGMRVFFRNATDLRVSSVDRNGAAGAAGIQRGWRITAINGQPIADTSQSSFIVSNVFNAATTSFSFLLPDNSSRQLTLNRRSFINDPMLADSVYQLGGNRVGYFVLNSFLGDTNQVRQNMDRVFGRFENAGVNELVVDLRYNGGGFVMLAAYLLNYLAPPGVNGQTMFTNQFNDQYTRFNSTTVFAKKGNLRLNRVFFIVSRQSASASEIVINSIRPFLDVKLVGPAATTGKPVGFYEIPVGNWFIFPVSFRTVNRNGEANFFNGIAPDYIAADGLDRNWGDTQEECLSRALRFISTGSWGRMAPVDEQSVQQQLRVQFTNTFLGASQFKGMVASPPRR